MTKQEKIQIVEYLSAEFKNASALIVCDYKGLRVSQLEELRGTSRSANIKVQVIKNTLANIAIKNAQCPNLELKDTNIFLWADDQIALSKVVCKFADSYNEHFSLKVGLFDKQVVDIKHIVSVSKLPSKEELIGMLLSVWTAPARYFVTGLDNLRKQKEEN
ncbi:50S ribosomal protein L10 [Helicobacter sp. MIT 03-1614]|uniref:50S ribosomal protein L10 n=1 Tax=Helicobacter sp. MIT 03-1614 TaxID=1548147 RepID=UPI000513A0B9|nr:50S ribosomal protein L10 [Helicobacter sp. MIT 03-1614]TLD87468.1 50S ribosomal protein L10 [Helicobacter sp. MIT 03-1614]